MTVAIGWIALGIAIAIGAWRMDRLTQMNIEPWSAPGLVPGLLGVLIALFGAALAWRERASRRAGGAGVSAAPSVPTDAPLPDCTAGLPDAAEPPAASAWRIVPTVALCAVFVFGLLGRGLPFMATSALLMFTWITMLRMSEWRAAGRVGRGLAGTATIALVAGLLISHLFQDVFLVRLP